MKSLLILVLAFFSVAAAQAKSYTTRFPATESPITEGGRWINGEISGVDWSDVRTTPGRAFGTQSGAGGYDDSTSLLTGVWGPNQTAQATVFTVNQQAGNINEEIEFRLRSAITAHRNTGYEINFRCRHDGSQYVEIVRWNGPLGSFTYVQRATGPGLYNGDVVKATIVGNVISAYINGKKVIQGTDSTFTNGNPGMGFFLYRGGRLLRLFLWGPSAFNSDFGLTNFAAWDD